MNFKNYIALALLVPVAIHAEFTAQKDGISIVVTTPAVGEQLVQSQGMSLKTEQFTAHKFNPVWIEITNSSDRQVELSNRSVSAAQIDKQVLVQKYKFRAALWPFLVWFGTFCVCNTISLSQLGYSFHLSAQVAMLAQENANTYNRDLRREWAKVDGIAAMSQEQQQQLFDTDARFAALRTRKGTVDHDCTQEVMLAKVKPRVEAFVTKYNWVWRLNSAVRWASIVYAIGVWWMLANFNKELEVLLNQQLLQDSIMIAPGQTIKKLVVLDGTAETNRFALSIFDARTHMVKSQFEVIV